MKSLPSSLLLVLALSSCATRPLPPEEAEHRAAAVYLKQAETTTTPDQERAALYLASAAEAYDLLGSKTAGEAGRVLYNQAVADLVVLLRSADNGAMWNRPLALSSGGTTWRLRFAPGDRNGVWDPGRFTSFTAAREVDLKTIEFHNRQDGIGGALVGVRKMTPTEPFAPPVAGVTREDWNVVGEERATRFFAKVKEGDLVDRATTFEANPKIDRLVFICTPHRGSEMALGSLGQLGRRLIALPADLTGTIAQTMGDSLTFATGGKGRMPNSVTGLSPNNPTLKVLDNRPITAPYHTILGDQGKGNSPQSSDGVVEYWSSHLKNAESEKIVPGPHGSCELPETLDELRRILRLHLGKVSR